MITQSTVTSAPQASRTQKMLPGYRRYSGNESASVSDLFEFLSFPSPEREEFLSDFCACSYRALGNIVSPNYQPK
ncbi:hypothetical protein ABLT32_10865 [Bacteroides pyogenes]|uniref:hypothetical protein n=1 Tax=Bacteroides pyogenes TaxID=310300 RepID=UPI004062E168